MNILTTRCKKLYDTVNTLSSNVIKNGSTVFGVTGTVLPQDFSGGNVNEYKLLKGKNAIVNNTFITGKISPGRTVNTTTGYKYAFNVYALTLQQVKKDNYFYIQASNKSTFIHNYWCTYTPGSNNGSFNYRIPVYCGSQHNGETIKFKVEWMVDNAVVATHNGSRTGTSSSWDGWYGSSASMTLDTFLAITGVRVSFPT